MFLAQMLMVMGCSPLKMPTAGVEEFHLCVQCVREMSTGSVEEFHLCLQCVISDKESTAKNPAALCLVRNSSQTQNKICL